MKLILAQQVLSSLFNAQATNITSCMKNSPAPRSDVSLPAIPVFSQRSTTRDANGMPSGTFLPVLVGDRSPFIPVPPPNRREGVLRRYNIPAEKAKPKFVPRTSRRSIPKTLQPLAQSPVLPQLTGLHEPLVQDFSRGEAATAIQRWWYDVLRGTIGWPASLAHIHKDLQCLRDARISAIRATQLAYVANVRAQLQALQNGQELPIPAPPTVPRTATPVRPSTMRHPPPRVALHVLLGGYFAVSHAKHATPTKQIMPRISPHILHRGYFHLVSKPATHAPYLALHVLHGGYFSSLIKGVPPKKSAQTPISVATHILCGGYFLFGRVKIVPQQQAFLAPHVLLGGYFVPTARRHKARPLVPTVELPAHVLKGGYFHPAELHGTLAKEDSLRLEYPPTPAPPAPHRGPPAPPYATAETADDAATRIQSTWRGTQGRKQAQERREAEHCADEFHSPVLESVRERREEGPQQSKLHDAFFADLVQSLGRMEGLAREGVELLERQTRNDTVATETRARERAAASSSHAPVVPVPPRFTRIELAASPRKLPTEARKKFLRPEVELELAVIDADFALRRSRLERDERRDRTEVEREELEKWARLSAEITEWVLRTREEVSRRTDRARLQYELKMRQLALERLRLEQEEREAEERRAREIRERERRRLDEERRRLEQVQRELAEAAERERVLAEARRREVEEAEQRLKHEKARREREETRRAVRIQRAWRMHAARRELAVRRRKREAVDQRQLELERARLFTPNYAASTIQRLVRRVQHEQLTYQLVLLARAEAERRQVARYTKWFEAEDRQEREEAATRIQSSYRRSAEVGRLYSTFSGVSA
eukprot:TRINITY_DN2831_c0_g1_i1.p1 TRINITY_DN2831_c0_g1~~TRINITY_DN2831_c0_g1_i1.p1  ORF type:complete len:835 (+),score=98.40 TRINITY_DN2831_c0_g1_i1:45-2549(+)